MTALYLHRIDQTLKIAVLRGMSPLSFNIFVKVHHEKMDALAEVPDPQNTLIQKLRTFVTDLDDQLEPLLPSAGSNYEFVVAAQTAKCGYRTGNGRTSFAQSIAHRLHRSHSFRRSSATSDLAIRSYLKSNAAEPCNIWRSRWTEF